jgi:hypothetical protein
VQGKIDGLGRRDLLDGDFKQVAGEASRLAYGVNEEKMSGLSGAEQDIEENTGGAGSNVDCGGRVRETCRAVEVIDHLGSKPVIPKKGIAAAQNENRFCEQVLEHHTPSDAISCTPQGCASTPI